MKEKIKNTLLITGAIDISNFSVPFVKITNLHERLQQYSDSLEYAINHYLEIDYIVFCENTNYQYDYSQLQEKAKQKGKILEILTFKGDYEKIQKKGKGFGEGEIIKYALENSSILAQSDCFYKLTGRLIIPNMDAIIRSTKSKEAFIFPPLTKRKFEHYVITLFYKVSTSFYKENLLNAYSDVNDFQDRYLEHVFYEKLSKIPLKSFKTHPKWIGFSASAGVLYTSSRKENLVNNIFARIGFFDNEVTKKQKKFLPIITFLRKIKRLFSAEIIIKTDGGISSQMHQYLLGRLYAEKGFQVSYDLRWFKKHGKDMNGVFERNFELLEAFPTLEFQKSNSLKVFIYQKFYPTQSNYFDHSNNDIFLFDLIPPKYLGDYYHSPTEVWSKLFPKYFKSNSQVLNEQKTLFDEIKQNKQSVAIHVRMGDLKEFNPAYGHPASVQYFQKAIHYFEQKFSQPFFYFFSDEPVSVEKELLKNLSVSANAYKIVSTEKGYTDLFLISACSHQITSKGSLGKFGALLNDSPEKIVVLCDDSTEYIWKDRLTNPVFL